MQTDRSLKVANMAGRGLGCGVLPLSTIIPHFGCLFMMRLILVVWWQMRVQSLLDPSNRKVVLRVRVVRDAHAKLRALSEGWAFAGRVSCCSYPLLLSRWCLGECPGLSSGGICAQPSRGLRKRFFSVGLVVVGVY